MHHIQDQDQAWLASGVTSWVVGMAADVPLMPVYMLCVAFLTPMVRRWGERLAVWLEGAVKRAPK